MVQLCSDTQCMMPQLAMPSTYFVDSKGVVLTNPVKGADFEKYTERIEEALQANG